MDHPVNRFRKWTIPLLLGIVLSFAYLHFFENRAYVELEIQVPKKTWFTLYWAKEGKGYSKWRRAKVRVYPGKERYHFYLSDLRGVARLRVDPQMYRGEVVLKGLHIRQNGKQPLHFTKEHDFKAFRPLFQIANSHWDKDGFHIASSGNDPQLELFLSLHDEHSTIWLLFVRLVAIFALIFLFFRATENFRQEEVFIPIFMVVAFTLVLIMAVISEENVHPDEYVHLDAADYYTDNFLPPRVDDPAIEHTYSVYGVSRLNGHEVSYFLTGKLSTILDSFHLPRYLSLRMFNVLLFFLLLLYIYKSPGARILAAPLLISPQLWYIFSYCNSDAFALAVGFILACQCALPSSWLNSYLLGRLSGNRLFAIVCFSCLGAALFLLKKNYLFFTIFLAGYLAWKMFFLLPTEIRRQYLKNAALITCFGAVLAGLHMGTSYMVNGPDMAAKKSAIQERLAEPEYKASTPLAKKHPFLYRKARGDSLKKIVTVDRWFEKSYRSAFGSYGYFTVVAVDSYYNTVRPFALLLFFLIVFGLVFRGGLLLNLLLLLFLSCSGGLIAASLYHSWTMDYQTQGRYLFPVVPMLCVLLYHARPLVQTTLYKVLLSALFLLSVYSFVFVALLRLPKIA